MLNINSIEMGSSKVPSGNTATKKGPSKSGDGKVKRNKKQKTFSTYIYKVLKQVHQDTGITKTSMSIMDSFINDIFERICLEASTLVRNSKKQTLSAREIKSSVELILPGELARHAIMEGTKALNKYAQSS